MSNILNKQVVIVTGAASGLGAAIARKLSEQGALLALADIDQNGLEKTSKSLPGVNELYNVDITSEDAVMQMINKAGNHFGRIDILVNCAGITGKTNIKSHETDTANLKKVFEINFMGSWYTSKYAIPWMLKNNYGRILHFASIAGKEGNAGMLAYSSSKAAVIGMTKVQGKEYAETGITVNAIAPAVIQTALVEAMPAEQVKYM